MSARLLSLREAAKLLGTTQPALTRAMRDAGHLLQGNVPAPELVKQGLLVTEPRCWSLDNGVKRHYTSTLVTVQGLAWLDQRINGTRLQEAS